MALIKSMVMFLCLLIAVQCGSEDLPISFTDYTAFLNGYFDNIAQTKDGNHDRIQYLAKPVLIPGLQKDPVLYVEEAVNGNLYRRVIFIRDESSTDRILHFSYYNFTDPGQFKFRSFNTDNLANITRADFRLNEGCQESYIQPSPGVLFGEAFDCRHSVNGNNPIYSVYLTCDSLRFEPPVAADETTSLLAYDIKHSGPRYPLINPPEGYINPCKDGL